MNKKIFRDALGWGISLWLIGYILGFIFFALVPPSQIGWFITPIGIAITLWVLTKKITSEHLYYYLKLSVAWTTIAVALDYLFIIKLLNPSDGYYKLDVYLYYMWTFVLPLLIGWKKTRKS